MEYKKIRFDLRLGLFQKYIIAEIFGYAGRWSQVLILMWKSSKKSRAYIIRNYRIAKNYVLEDRHIELPTYWINDRSI